MCLRGRKCQPESVCEESPRAVRHLRIIWLTGRWATQSSVEAQDQEKAIEALECSGGEQGDVEMVPGERSRKGIKPY